MKHTLLSCGLGLMFLFPTPSSAQNTHQLAVLGVLDTNQDQKIDCAELAAFLEPHLTSKLRGMGIEPRLTSNVPPCGSRPSALPLDFENRGPESDFAEFFRKYLNSVLNAATSDGNDTVEPAEIAALEGQKLPAPLDDDKISSLLPQATPPPKKKSWLDDLDKWINVRQSFLDEQGIGKPAKLSLTNHSRSDETVEPGDPRRFWTFKTAVVLDPPKEWDWGSRVFLRPVLAYELNIASNAPKKDQIVHRGGLTWNIIRKDATAPFSGHLLDTTFDFYTDRGYDARVFGATAEYTFNYRAIGIGQYLGKGAAVDFRWRPYVGVVWAHVNEPGQVEAYGKMSDFTHGFLRITTELKLGDAVKITPEGKLWRGNRTKSDGTVAHWQALSSLEGRWIIARSKSAERVSLSLTGSAGRESPDFLMTRQMVLALAIKF